LSATEPGSEFQFEFDGNAAGLMIGSGPDSGIIEVSVDGGATRKIDTLTQWSGGLYLPWAVILADGLRSGHHSVRVRLTAERHPGSAGTALYVFNLMEN
jgi:sialidase-1